jgi:hypothetical protein
VSKLIHRELEQEIDPHLEGGSGPTPGKRSMTQGLTPRAIIFRVESAEAARELGAAFGPRDHNGVAAGAEDAVERAAGGGGEPLRADVRERFESSLGADLSAVRVHTGGESAEASSAVGAKAYTVGNDIHFGAGQYRPDDPFGLHLLAHEVAHTQQQAAGTPHRQNKLEVSTPTDSAEVEADRAADAMVSGAPAEVTGGGGFALKRKKGTEAVGGDTDDAEVLHDGRIYNADAKTKPTVEPGSLGYSEVLVTQEIPNQEGASAALAEGELLPAINPTYSDLNKAVNRQSNTVGEYDTQEAENHHFKGIRRNEVARERLQMLYAQREEIAAKFYAYNAWKGMPNSAIMALQRLDSMKSAYGVSDEAAMLEAVKKGAENAKKVMAVAQAEKHAGNDSKELEQVEDAIPKEDIDGALKACDTALAELGTAHGDFRAVMMKNEEAKKEDDKGEDARKRRAEITALKQDIQTLCTAVDGGMAAINTAPGKLNQMATAVNNAADNAGAKKELAKNAARAQSGHPQHMTVAKDFESEWANLTSGPPTASAERAPQFAQAKSPLATPEAQYDTIPALPTSAGGLVAAGAGVAMDLAFAKEMHEIDVKLNAISAKVSALKGLGISIDIDTAKTALKTKLMAFHRAMDVAAKRMQKSRTDYTRFGERMDALARKHAGKLDKGQAPGAGEEMYAMIFAVAGQLKEVAAYSSQAGGSAGRTGHGGAQGASSGKGLGEFTSSSVRSWASAMRSKRKAAEREWSGYGEMNMGNEMGAINQLVAVLAGWEATKGRIESCAAVSAQVDAVLATLRPL